MSLAHKDSEIPVIYTVLLTSAYSLSARGIDLDKLRAAAINPDSLPTGLRSGRIQLAHGSVDNRFIQLGEMLDLDSSPG